MPNNSNKDHPRIIKKGGIYAPNVESNEIPTTVELTQKFFNKVIENSEHIPHDPKFPFIKWYAQHLKKWREENPEDTFHDWIVQNNHKIQKKKSTKELFGILSIAVGLTVALSVAFGGPLWLIAIAGFLALVNGFVSLWNGGKLNRDIEGRGYLLKSMESKVHHMIVDLTTKIDELPNSTEKTSAQEKIKQTIQEMKSFQKDHYRKSVFYKKWGSMGFRQGLGYTIGGARLILGSLVVVGVFTSLPLPVTIGLILGALACEVTGFILYTLSLLPQRKG